MIISGARDSPSASTPATPSVPASASTHVAMRRPSWSTRRSSGVWVTAISPSIVARRPIALVAPVRVISRKVFPRTTSVPLKALSPAALSTGTDSPVRMASSTMAP